MMQEHVDGEKCGLRTGSILGDTHRHGAQSLGRERAEGGGGGGAAMLDAMLVAVAVIAAALVAWRTLRRIVTGRDTGCACGMVGVCPNDARVGRGCAPENSDEGGP